MVAKRGQITLFIILGILILLGVGIYIVIQGQGSSSQEPNFDTGMEMSAFRSYVESCMSEVGHDAVHWVTKRGGYFELPELSTHEEFVKAPYYFHEDKIVMPTELRVGAELSRYMNLELLFCVRNFADFKDQGYTVTFDAPYTEVDLGPKSVIFNTQMRVTAQKDGKVGTAQMFRSIVNAPVFKYYTIAQAIATDQMSDPTSLCLSCLSELATENQVKFDLARMSDTIVLFQIKDPPYTYMFANKYKTVSCSSIPHEWSEERKQQYQLDCLRDGLVALGG